MSDIVVPAADTQVDDVQCVEAEVNEIVAHGLAQLLGSYRTVPAALGVASPPTLVTMCNESG